ncbi:MAG: hydrolase [Deferrisomatales bacterium]|nr:hydrolase [Deferrisomatales bacterium]
MLIDAKNCCLLVIDIQEKLVPAVHQSETLIERARWLIEIAHRLEVPVLASEQYPRGLGRTVAPVAAVLGERPVLEKLHFSCAADPGCRSALDALGRGQVVLVGMEAHVCVLQTALGLRQQGKDVFVVADVVSSRDPEDKALALARMGQAGVGVVSREMVVFEWLHLSGSETFREISKNFLR